MKRHLIRSVLLLIGTFITLPSYAQEKPLLKIGLVADPQYADQPVRGQRYYRESIWKLAQAIDSFHTNGVDFIQTLGDVIDNKRESFDSIIPIYKKLKPDIESYHVLGNHDFSVDSLISEDITNLLDMPAPYYSYQRKGWRFIVLDGTDFSFYANYFHQQDPGQIKSYFEALEGKPNQQTWNGAIGREQQGWLRSELSDADEQNERVIVFCHFPIYPPEHSENLWNDEEILSILTGYPQVVAYINGHNHAGNYAIKEHIHCITLFGMVDTMINSFAILEVYSDRLWLNGYGNQEDLKIILNK